MTLPTPYYHDENSGITIYHGDCREILPDLVPESVTLLWTDPPYGHANQNGDLQSARVGVKGARQRQAVPIRNDDALSMREVVDKALELSIPLLKKDSCCCCCCGGGGPEPTFAWLADRLDRKGLSFFHALIWDKTARGPGLGWRFRRDYEMVMVAHAKGGKLSWNPEAAATSNILRFAPEPNIYHPTTKPVSMCRSFIGWHTRANDFVLDPFMGSGTTLRAAKDLGRKAIGIELEERYVEIAIKRLQQSVLPLEEPLSDPVNGARHALF
jgi:site-specific DNA-methyltransferase (adenine-specific)